MGRAPEGVRPTALYEILKSGNGQAATRAISDFVKKSWFSGYVEGTSNFKVNDGNDQPPVDFERLYDSVKDMGAEELVQLRAQTKLADKHDRSPGTEGHALLKCSPEIRQLRRLQEKRESKRKLQDGIVFRVGEPSCTKLVFPDDVPALAAKLGRTYNPLTKQNEIVSLSDYVGSKLHLEKTLVLWGPAGIRRHHPPKQSRKSSPSLTTPATSRVTAPRR